MRIDLPKGWIRTELENCFEIYYGKGLPKSKRRDGIFPVYGSNGPVGFHNQSLTQGVTIIIGRKGSVGAIHLSKMPCWPIDTTYYIDSFEICNSSLARYLLEHVKLYELESSSAIPGINRKKIYKLKIPLPPLNEQKRIAAKLDKIMPRIEAVKERLERIPLIIKRFRQSVLTAAVTGKLTEKWREEHPDVMNALSKKNLKFEDFPFDLPKSWFLCKINDITKNSFYGPRFNRKYYVEQGVPTIRTTDFTGYGAISLKSDTPKLKLTNEQKEKYRLEYGDILITRTGTIGAMAIFKENYIALPSAYLIRFRFVEDVNNDYIFHYMQSTYFQGLMGLKKSAVTQPNLNAEKIKSLPIPLPPLEEQKEIVRQVDTLFSFADKLEAHYQKAKEKILKLPQSILAKAFRGDLVPQDPGEEPAHILLEKIKDEKERIEKPGKKKETDGFNFR